MSFQERLARLVALRGLDRPLSSHSLGIPPERAEALLAGGCEPAPDELLAMCSTLGANLTWLGCGVGPSPEVSVSADGLIDVDNDAPVHRIDAIDRLRTHGDIDERSYIDALLAAHPCDRHCALRMAARHGRYVSLRAMLAENWHLGAGEGGYIVAAAQSGVLESLRLLDEAGADLCEMDGRALFEAAAGGYGACVQYLVDHAPLGLADLLEGYLSALSNQRADVAGLILSHARHAGYDIVTGNERQIASAATLGSWPSVIPTLRSVVSLPALTHALEEVALPRAVANNSLEGIELLVDAGCNPCANRMAAFVVALTVEVPRRVFEALSRLATEGGFVTANSVAELAEAGHMIEAYGLAGSADAHT